MIKRVAVFIGTRPEAIKMAPVVHALLAADGLEPIVVSTGQHRELLQPVFELFEIPVHHDLDVMVKGQSLGELSARLMHRIDAVLESESPDFALVQGDTTTVLMAALASFYRSVPIGHVEAGLRTGDIQNPFPEEANRRLVTPLVTLHFPPTDWAASNLRGEGIPEGQILVTGNTVIDALYMERTKQEEPTIQAEIDELLAPQLGHDWRDRRYTLITGHRRENHGAGFVSMCRAIRVLAGRFATDRFIYPVHLNPRVRATVTDELAGLTNVILLDPLPYRPFVALMSNAHLILTDSGGIQEEAPALGKPVLVTRKTSERPEGIAAGTVRLVTTNEDLIIAEVSKLLTDDNLYSAMARAHNPYGDGHAATRIVKKLETALHPAPEAQSLLPHTPPA